MYYNEAYEERMKEEQALLKKWEKALNVDGGIEDEHLARTTAIVLENYLQYLHSDPRLIAEDRVTTSAFTGVNLALLGLIARVIPNLVGAELVGMQAMPTPKSPIFTIAWKKDDTKGATTAGEEMWTTPVNHAEFEVGLDPYYSSQTVKDPVNTAASAYTLNWANVVKSYTNFQARPFLFAGTMYLTAYDADGNVLEDWKTSGDYTSAEDFVLVSTTAAGVNSFEDNETGSKPRFNLSGSDRIVEVYNATTNAWPTDNAASTPVDIEKWVVSYEYRGEAEPSMPEISFEITETQVDLTRRQLRGKYTMDAAYDLKKYHGINLDSELTNMMKVELQAEINREIMSDLRMLAGITHTFDYATLTSSQVTIAGNYEDAHRILLDAINKVAAKIHLIGRLGRANFVVGNPLTLAFLDRVPGFVGSGVSYNGKELSYAGAIGGKMKFYHDPLFPQDELLIGYKGSGALDAGYIHCPYLPITATPTLINPETGDPAKIFYTRYGKTFNMKGGVGTNLILNGQYQYARMFVKGMPDALTV